MAEIQIEPDWAYEEIALAAGAALGGAQFWPGDGGRLLVPGVSQEALEAAVAAYDHLAVCRAWKMAEIRGERNQRLDDTDWMAVRSWERGVISADFAMTKEGKMRQVLREIPQTIELEAIKTPKELEAFEPDWPTLEDVK